MISEKVIKKLSQVFNCIFVLTGLSFIGTGIGVMNQYYKYDVFLDGKFHTQIILFIICGSLTLLIALLGYIVAYKKNYCLMLTICGMLCLLFILGITAGTIGFILRDQSYGLIRNNLNSSIKNYLNGDHEIQKSWDNLHREFGCCGGNSFRDWSAIFEKEVETNDVQHVNLPFSCCNNVGQIGFANCTYLRSSRYYINENEKINQFGCSHKLGYIITNHVYALGIVAFTFASIHFIGILVALLVIRILKKY